MLNEAFAGLPAPTTSPGVNATKQLEFTGGAIVFHKAFSRFLAEAPFRGFVRGEGEPSRMPRARRYPPELIERGGLAHGDMITGIRLT
jgi:hypothetical protein